MLRNFRLFHVGVFFCIFLLALSIRLYHLDSLPINHDEAKYARILLMPREWAFKSLTMTTRIFYFLLFPPILIIYPSGFTQYFLNNFAFFLRLPSALIGAFTVFLTYSLTKQMYGRKEAVVASLLLCFLPWHILQSRIANPVISVSFFGCFIFLCLFNFFQERKIILKSAWFILSCVLLKISFIYEGALLFIPIFLLSLLYLRTEIKFKVMAIGITFLFISPVIYAIVRWGNWFWNIFYRAYHQNIFEGHLLLNIANNLKNNLAFAIGQLFFNFKPSSLLYGKALRAPLLIHPLVSIIFLLSLFKACWKRTTADKILLTWLSLGFLGGIGGVNYFEPRYILIILPPLIILLARLIVDLFNHIILIKSVIKREFLLMIGIFIFGFMLQNEMTQWAIYYHLAPVDLDECRYNSFGSKEAAEYLYQWPDIEKYTIVSDTRMTAHLYYCKQFLLFNKNKDYYEFIEKYDPSELFQNRRVFDANIITSVLYKIKMYTSKKMGLEKKHDYSIIYGSEVGKRIYVLWAPESHPVDFWNGWFRQRFDKFKKNFPDEKPIKTIYYPNGLPAIYIFKIG